MPRGLVLLARFVRCLHLHPDSPTPQAVLEIRLRGSGLLIHSPSLWAVPGSLDFYEVHRCGSFPAETDGNPHPELPRLLAPFCPVGGRASISQIRAPQPLRVPRTKGPFCQECAVPQPTNLIPGNSYRLSPNEGGSHARPFSSSTSFTDATVTRWVRPALQLWLRGRTISGWNGACLWAWFAVGRWSQQMPPT